VLLSAEKEAICVMLLKPVGGAENDGHEIVGHEIAGRENAKYEIARHLLFCTWCLVSPLFIRKLKQRFQSTRTSFSCPSANPFELRVLK